jgi:16S rRNA (uracil1498-N3)-methyltransferase
VDPPIFYCPPDRIRDESAELPAEESHHAITVLRLQRGNLAMIVDGLGTAYRGEVAGIAGRKKVVLRLHSEIRNFGEPSVILTLAAGLSVGSRFDTVVEKGTELGVKRFVPIISERSRVRLEDSRRAAARVRRFERVALAATKQCRRSYRPDVSVPVALTEYLRDADPQSLNLLFHACEKSIPLGRLGLRRAPRRVAILVGPESGFTAEEVALAGDTGFKLISLGPRILRTETAGPVACALVMNFLGELS